MLEGLLSVFILKIPHSRTTHIVNAIGRSFYILSICEGLLGSCGGSHSHPIGIAIAFESPKGHEVSIRYVVVFQVTALIINVKGRLAQPITSLRMFFIVLHERAFLPDS